MTAVGDEIAVLLGGGTMLGTITARNNDGTVSIHTAKPLIGNDAVGHDFIAEAILVYRIVELPCPNPIASRPSLSIPTSSNTTGNSSKSQEREL